MKGTKEVKHCRSCLIVLGIISFLLLGFPQKQSVGEIISKIPLEVTAKSLEGKTVSLSDYKGKLVFLNIWRTDCIACLMEIPVLNKLQKEYSSENFTVIGVSLDRENKQQVTAVAKQAKIAYPIWLAYGEPIIKYVDVQYTPSLVVLGPHGEVLLSLVGALPSYEYAVGVMNQARDVMKEKSAPKSP